jgi:uncharacterized glyoxalase superfamily protein PhnB/catechol 2,3-dioxygenase-like lactoylglutathione lyase family enzyme
MIANRSAPCGTVVPSLIYNDVAKAIDWLCDAFGCRERLRAAGADGTITHAQLAIGQGGVMLGASRVDHGNRTDFRPPRRDEVSHSIFVHIEDVDAHYEHAQQRGATIVHPPVAYPYGEKQYTAEDLEGHRWTFSQALADVNPEEWGAAVSEIKGPLELLPRPRLCYLEIPALDLRESPTFYEKVFGWNIRFRDSTRPSFDDATGYVSGAWVLGRAISREPGLLPYIWVDTIDVTLARVAAHGGELVEASHLDSPGGEWIATFRDPAGNVIGLYQPGPR